MTQFRLAIFLQLTLAVYLQSIGPILSMTQFRFQLTLAVYIQSIRNMLTLSLTTTPPLEAIIPHLFILLSLTTAHNAQNSVPGVPPSCSQAVQARVSAEIPRLFPNPEDRSNVRVVVNPPNNNRNRPSNTCGCVTLCVITVGLLIYLYFLPDQQACPDSPVASGCIPSRRRNLHDSSAQCERWDIKACASGTSLTAKHSAQSGAPEVAAGGHRNRNAARMSYRRRLELV
ncbi:hypothetical protein F5051DRAFT_23474 [Lentinula edodes]|nr:hypothetical protein F5051DRAFT_23474 [Lentinula edodes]